MIRCQQCGSFNRVPAVHPAGRPACGRCGAGLDPSGRPQAVDAEGLARAIRASPVPVLVDFWAPWCGPCVMAAPVLEEIARAFMGELVVLKLDTERDPLAAEIHSVHGIPTFILFVEGQEQARQTGLLPRARFHEWVARHLASPRCSRGLGLERRQVLEALNEISRL